jgi:hydrogenase 3 maturation protease
VYFRMKKLLAATDKLKLFIGIGNVLHCDDGVGVYIARKLCENQHIRVINAEVSIENYIGKINTMEADIIILIDSMFLGRKPGFCELVPIESLSDITTHTHNMSLRKIADFLNSEIFVLGIQPAIVSFGEGLSSPVHQTANRIVALINSNNTCF